MKSSTLRTGVAALVLLLGGVMASPARADDDEAVARAHAFLGTAERGTDVLGFLHAGARYRGHQLKAVTSVEDGAGNRVPGHLALVYHYRWGNDGFTDVAFLWDEDGALYDALVVRTNAILSQPFALARASIALLGAVVLEAFDEHLTAQDRRLLRRLVEAADVRTLMVWNLRFQQAFSSQ